MRGRDPFGRPQLISWLCLCVSLFLVIHGVGLWGMVGRPDERRADAWGALLKSPSWAAVGLAAVATGFQAATARTEEAENVRSFGAAYREYMERTKMFIPFVF